MLGRKPKQLKQEEDVEEEEIEENDDLDEQPEEQEPAKMQRVSASRLDSEHRAGDNKLELVRLPDGSLREVTRVWANGTESAVSTDPLLILLAKTMFKEMGVN